MTAVHSLFLCAFAQPPRHCAPSEAVRRVPQSGHCRCTRARCRLLTDDHSANAAAAAADHRSDRHCSHRIDPAHRSVSQPRSPVLPSPAMASLSHSAGARSDGATTADDAVTTAATASSASAPSVTLSPPPAITYPPVSAAARAAGKVTIVGFGSLLSARSAASTFGEGALSNFRPGLIRHFRRVFAHVAPIFIERDIARVDTREMASLSVEPCEGQTLLVSVFEVRWSAAAPWLCQPRGCRPQRQSS